MNKQRPLIEFTTDAIKFNSDKVIEWYHNKNIIREFVKTGLNYKYLSFMKYNNNGSFTRPHRWNIMMNNEKSYKFLLARNYIGYKPVSVYRDIDNWKLSRKVFSNDYETKKEEQKVWTMNKEYRTHQLNPDFVIDIDGESPFSTWNITNKILMFFNQFNVTYSVFCSGSKGWQIIVPGHKSIKKEYWIDDEGKEQNTHYALALDLNEYLGVGEWLDLSAYYDIRFIKQPYSLDGRNMRPIVPLSYTEFVKFKEISDDLKDEEHPMLTIDYWLIMGVEDRGMMWNNNGDMLKLEQFLDEQLGE